VLLLPQPFASCGVNSQLNLRGSAKAWVTSVPAQPTSLGRVGGKTFPDSETVCTKSHLLSVCCGDSFAPTDLINFLTHHLPFLQFVSGQLTLTPRSWLEHWFEHSLALPRNLHQPLQYSATNGARQIFAARNVASPLPE